MWTPEIIIPHTKGDNSNINALIWLSYQKKIAKEIRIKE